MAPPNSSTNLPKPVCANCAARERLEGPLLYNGVPVREMEAFPLKLAAKLIGAHYSFIYRRVRSGKLRMSPGKLISRAELERFLAQDYFEEKKKAS